jgi:type IV pilus assembly protein PilP
MNRRARAIPWLAAAWLAAALAGCGGDLSDLQRYVAQVKARKNSRIEPIPQIKPYQPFAYDPGNRRDPFEPTAPSSAAAPGVRPDLKRNKEPLEDYPLDALKFVGVIDYNHVTYAMIKAPDGIIHRVTVGNYLGQNFGRITKITEAEVSLTEIVPDGFGGYKEQPAKLAAEEK